MELNLLYRDDHLVAIDKPSGLLVHRSALAGDRVTCMTLLRDLLGRWVYPVHRLDRGASGALLFALDRETAGRLSTMFAERAIDKLYLAVVRGWAPAGGTIDYPLAETKDDLPVEAVTRFAALERVELPLPVGRYATARYSLVAAGPITGRRHQIRRHLAHLRHPLIGDAVHGEGRHNRLFRERFGIHRLLLHAASVELPHPITSQPLRISAPLTPELVGLFDEFGWDTAPRNYADTIFIASATRTGGPERE